MRRSVPWLVHVLVPLSLGLGFYLAFRSLDVPILAWMGRIEVVETLRARSLSLVPQLPRFVNDSFVDGLSAYALGAALSLIWRADQDRRRWLLGGYAVALGFEFVQWPDAIPGVFGWTDVIAILLMYPLGAILAGNSVTSWPPKMLPSG